MFILFRYLMNTWPIHQNWNFCTLKERHSAIKERKEPKFKHGVHFFPWIIMRCNKTFLKIIIVIRWPNHLIRYVHPLFYTKISLWRFFVFFVFFFRLLQEFYRQGNATTIDMHHLPKAIVARYIRFLPTNRHKHNCLRVEVYGTKGDLWLIKEGNQWFLAKAKE